MKLSLHAARQLVTRLTVTLLACTVLALVVSMYAPVIDWVTDPLLIRPDFSQASAIVLMTAWSSPDRMLTDAGLRRTIEAARLYRSGVAPVIVVSGRNRSEDSGPTAAVMADLLGELGVPNDAIVLETTSTNTHESAQQVLAIAAQRNWTSITIVTDARHARRAISSYQGRLTARSGTDLRPAMRTPVGVGRLPHMQQAMHEWAGLAYYWYRGWL